MILIRTIITVLVLIGALICLPLLLTEDIVNDYEHMFLNAFYIATDVFIIVMTLFALGVQWS